MSNTAEMAWFDLDAWRACGQLCGTAEGRGEAYFLRADAQQQIWVLRHYRRGGLLARLNRHRYLWTGVEAIRPVRELRLLSTLHNRGLPVPRPVAARAVRRGFSYTADLITVAIPNTRPLADSLAERALPHTAWRRLGAVIADLHQAGVWHADLNARNVLTTPEHAFHLIDFDRARFRGDGAWRAANLKRFRRSLDKFADRWAVFHFTEEDWQALLAGYRAVFGRL